MPKSLRTTLITRSKVLKALKKTFDLVFKVVHTDFDTRSKVLIMLFLALKTFDLVFKVVCTDFGTRSKVKKTPQKLIKVLI